MCETQKTALNQESGWFIYSIITLKTNKKPSHIAGEN